MQRTIFPNLPVANLQKSTDFYLGLGFTRYERFCTDSVTAVSVAENIILLLVRAEFFQTFLPKGDYPHLRSSSKEVLLSLTCSSRDDVDAMVAAAARGGGAVYAPTRQDAASGMYGGSATDPDGHILDFVWMGPAPA